MQPISKLEVPQAYLDMPNGRTVYMLKTWMLKQADIVRRDIVQKARRGDKRGATEAALRFSLILGISGATTEYVKNALLGRDDKLELEDVPNNVLKTFGWSQYTLDKVRQGKGLEAAAGIVAPPYKMWDEILARDPKAVQYLPVVGRIVYADNLDALGIETGFRGADIANAKTKQKDRREERERLGLELSDEEKKRRRDRQLDRELMR